jgi:hypothetical protein
MPIRDKEENSILQLTIDNGDLTKLKEALEKWSFKDYQSLLRFSISVLLLNEGQSISIKTKGFSREVKPAPDLLKPTEASHG